MSSVLQGYPVFSPLARENWTFLFSFWTMLINVSELWVALGHRQGRIYHLPDTPYWGIPSQFIFSSPPLRLF